jgi:hypothetical protein
MTGQKRPSRAEIFRRSLPWKDVTLGFIVPKAIFYISMNKAWLTTGVLVAILWCVGVFAAKYLRARKVNWFALLALATIVVQMIPVVIKHNPNLHFVAVSLNTMLYAAVFLISIIMRKPLIQFFAEAGGAKEHIPPAVVASPSYLGAWMIITGVWAIVYFVQAAILLLLALQKSHMLIPVDILFGWPTTIVLILFSMEFPKWYWRKLV